MWLQRQPDGFREVLPWCSVYSVHATSIRWRCFATSRKHVNVLPRSTDVSHTHCETRVRACADQENTNRHALQGANEETSRKASCTSRRRCRDKIAPIKMVFAEAPNAQHSPFTAVQASKIYCIAVASVYNFGRKNCPGKMTHISGAKHPLAGQDDLC